ncbi:hypothetical protein BC828DRAFT_281892 [Blastocladiella britannica]|nr:hypothetical protein BC828DRAFT_281892 [Blastocladiella britannica]
MPYPEQAGQQQQTQHPEDLLPTRTVIRAYPMPLDILQTLCQLVPALAAVPATYMVPMLRFDYHRPPPQQPFAFSSTHEPLRLMLYRTQKKYAGGASENPDHSSELLLADNTPLLLSFCFTTPFSTTSLSHGSAMPDDIRVQSGLSIDQKTAATRAVYRWCVDELRLQGYHEPWDPDAIMPTSWDLLGESHGSSVKPSSKNPGAFLHLGSAALLSSDALLALADLIPKLCQTQGRWSDVDVWISASDPVAVHVSRTASPPVGIGWVADRPRSLDARRIASATFVSPLTALLDRGPKTRLGTFVASLAMPDNRIPSVHAAAIASRAYRWAVGAVRAAGGHVYCEPAVQAVIDEALLAQFAEHVQTIQQLHLNLALTRGPTLIF